MNADAIAAQHEKDLTLDHFRREAAQINAALDQIAEAELLDWQTYAEQFERLADITGTMHALFQWAADEAAHYTENPAYEGSTE